MTKRKELSDRAMILLWIISEHTEKDWSTGKLERFFVPQSSPYYYNRGRANTWRICYNWSKAESGNDNEP